MRNFQRVMPGIAIRASIRAPPGLSGCPDLAPGAADSLSRAPRTGPVDMPGRRGANTRVKPADPGVRVRRGWFDCVVRRRIQWRAFSAADRRDGSRERHRPTKTGDSAVNRFESRKNSGVISLAIFIVACTIAAPGPVCAGEPSADDANMEILREKLKADKKLLVAANLELADGEAMAFWPIYDQYQKELQALNTRIGPAIDRYAEAYNSDTLNDAMAKKLIDDVTAIDEDEIRTRKSYAAKLAAVLPGKKVARHLQIENKIRALLRFDLAAAIPLVP
jgi:hypothetical protein